MKKAVLPVEKAVEPEEDARQPEIESSMTPMLKGAEKTPHHITFADDTDVVTPPQSQKSSSYREALSQPAPGLSHREKLQWLQKRRTCGLWAQCDECNKWRYLPKVLDSYELPKKWYCRLNPDPESTDCAVPQVPIRVRDEEDLIHAEYSAGSVVWARMAGWPWWPAVVDDCPDTEQYYWLDGFSDIPTHYNVTFFDEHEVTRGWVAPQNLKSFTTNKDCFKPYLKNKKYKARLAAAIEQANAAVKLPLKERLAKCSFVARYAGKINSPKTDKKEVRKQQALLKRKFKIPFETFDSDHETDQPNTPRLVSDVMTILGTQKIQEKTPSVSKRARKMLNNETDETDAQTASENAAGEKDMAEGQFLPGVQFLNGKKRLLAKYTELKKSTELNTETDSNIETFKEQTSLAVQVGSNSANSLIIEESFDNDTSKTYVPDQESQLSQTQLSQTQLTLASQNSDDFEY